VKKFFRTCLWAFGIPLSVYGQTTYLPLHTEEYFLLDRLEAKTGMLAPYFFELKPVARQDAVDYLKAQKQSVFLGQSGLNAIDQYDIRRALSISGEWVETAEGMDGTIPSQKPVLRYFTRCSRT